MPNRISSFPPIISETSKILILGSVPGIKSLEMQQYYAHPQNKFWRILFELFQEDFTKDYSKKLKFLEKNHIAVWDVIDSCEREGSLDTKIKNEVHNDVEQILMDYQNIKAIFCNGQKSFKNVQNKMRENPEIPIFVLPSTSPAYTIPFVKKVEEWKIIKNFI
ncbi:DNA-deoxyinosine glycosylase [Kaistella jeonii]|uniref:DNA glycosylase n=1 Tax=Kaistella jeonii TaxID=266749 RepID=A0A0C1FF67_9FLAO|nr:DNA-deoxyinosine glycosylase [Kaistella jeonii]KIA90463.1 DNA glycosylase [Kaistella jeonii]SFB72480.1 hypoxanthine-DNA glycosylase [Kaistella jeonii]VEI94970.1 G:T/U mismatch-specific DNA glycosylase [Kaistella jeonii]